MAHSIELKLRKEEKTEDLRKKSLVPGVVYGPERKSVSVYFDSVKLEKLYSEAGESTLIDCKVEGEKESAKILIQDLQYHPVKNQIIHFDLKQIKMGVEMYVTIEFNFTTEAPAVKEQGGTLVINTEELNVKCLPKDLVNHIDVDLTSLKTFEDAIQVKDIKLPEGIITTDDENVLIAKVIAPISEEKLKAMEEENANADASKVEVEGEKEKEGEEVEGEKEKDGEEKEEGKEKNKKENK